MYLHVQRLIQGIGTGEISQKLIGTTIARLMDGATPLDSALSVGNIHSCLVAAQGALPHLRTDGQQDRPLHPRVPDRPGAACCRSPGPTPRRSRRSRSFGTQPSRRLSTETKAAFKTTEFIAYLGSVIAVLVAAQVIGDNGAANDADYFRADRAFLYITILTVGYMVSRGLAKSGSRDFYDADNNR